MTWDEDRQDYGIFKIEHAFSKFFCITRLMTWICAFIFFYCHVIIMWGRWSDPDGVWLWTATYSGTAAIVFHSMSDTPINWSDPLLFNKWFAKLLYGALAGFSLYHFHLDHNYSFGAWLTPLASLILTGVAGVTIVQEFHRIAMAYNKHGYCKRFKEQLINTGEVTQYCCNTPKCLKRERQGGASFFICCALIYIGVSFFVLWGYAHTFDIGSTTHLDLLLFIGIFILEWMLGTAWHCTILRENIFKSVMIMFVFTAIFNALALGIGAVFSNVYIVVSISLAVMIPSIIFRFKAEEGKAVLLLGKAEGILIFASLPVFHLLYHHNIVTKGSAIYCGLMMLLFIAISGIGVYIYYKFKKNFSK